MLTSIKTKFICAKSRKYSLYYPSRHYAPILIYITFRKICTQFFFCFVVTILSAHYVFTWAFIYNLFVYIIDTRTIIRLSQWQCSDHEAHGFNYHDVTMDSIASQITSLTIVYSAVYSAAYQRKHQSSASLAFVRGIHRGPVNSPHKGPVTRKMFPFDDVIM